MTEDGELCRVDDDVCVLDGGRSGEVMLSTWLSMQVWRGRATLCQLDR